MRKWWRAQTMLMSVVVLLGGVIPQTTWAGALRCTINTGGAAPFSPYTRENPIAVDEDTPDYSVLLSLDYAQFLPNMRLSCTTDGQEVAAPAGFDGTVSLSLSAINDTALDWTGEAQTNNNGVKLRLYIKAVSYNDETLANSYSPAKLATRKSLGVEYPVINGKDDTTLFEFGAQYNADKSLYKFDETHNYAIESMRAELVKLGWIEYSALPVIPAGAHLTFTVDGLSGVATVDVPLGSGVYMAAPSCSLDSAHQTVDLGNFNKRSSGSFPQEGAQTRFGIGFTCSSYTNNVEFTFDDANATLKGNDKLVAHSEADGKKLTGVAVALYDAQGNPIIMGTKQNIGSAQQGANTAYYQAAIVQTAAEITDSSSASFAGKITAKANVTITYY